MTKRQTLYHSLICKSHNESKSFDNTDLDQSNLSNWAELVTVDKRICWLWTQWYLNNLKNASGRGDLHPHLRGEGGEWRESTTGQNDAAHALIHQVLHAESRREAPVTKNVAYEVWKKREERKKSQIKF